MAIAPEILNEVAAAYRAAVDSINIDGQEPIFLDDQRNANIVREYLLKQTAVPTAAWKSEFVWRAAILDCRAQNLLVPLPVKKPREEINAERDARDRVEGSPVGNAHSHYKPRAKATEEEMAKAKQWYADLKDPVAANRRKTEEKAAQEIAAANEQRQLMELFQDPSVEFADYTPEQLAAFKKLTPVNMRLIGAKRDDYKRGKAQEAAAARRKSQ